MRDLMVTVLRKSPDDIIAKRNDSSGATTNSVNHRVKGGMKRRTAREPNRQQRGGAASHGAARSAMRPSSGATAVAVAVLALHSVASVVAQSEGSRVASGAPAVGMAGWPALEPVGTGTAVQRSAGNHRMVILVDSVPPESNGTVIVTAVWRRHDSNPEMKNTYIVDAESHLLVSRPQHCSLGVSGREGCGDSKAVC